MKKFCVYSGNEPFDRKVYNKFINVDQELFEFLELCSPKFKYDFDYLYIALLYAEHQEYEWFFILDWETDTIKYFINK